MHFFEQFNVSFDFQFTKNFPITTGKNDNRYWTWKTYSFEKIFKIKIINFNRKQIQNNTKRILYLYVIATTEGAALRALKAEID